MQISYRALSVALLLGLGRRGLAQTAPPPTREDSVKGRIWTATAQRVWADEKAAAPPKKWATGADFKSWVFTQKPDKTELGSLFSAVLTRVGQGQPATPTQVAQAILAEVSQRKAHKTGALARVNLQALQVDLAPFVPAASTTSAVLVAADSAMPAAQPTGTARTLAENPNPVPEGLAGPVAPAYTVQPLEPRYFGLPPALAGAALVLLGALLGMGLARQWQPKRRQHRPPATAPLAESETLSDMNPVEFRKLEYQNKQLRKELQQIKQQLADLQKRLPGAPAVAAASAPAAAAHVSATSLMAAAVAAQAVENLPPAAAPPAAADLSIEELVGAQPAAPQPAATRYGPVQETPFVEERKIVDAPLPQLALMLSVHPHQPDQATFTLNPSVDQARLIGDGLTRLQKFFDYDPPLGGRITLVAAAAPGQLQRHADGWQVVQRARLTIS